jgi:hypothetical protein
MSTLPTASELRGQSGYVRNPEYPAQILPCVGDLRSRFPDLTEGVRNIAAATTVRPSEWGVLVFGGLKGLCGVLGGDGPRAANGVESHPFAKARSRGEPTVLLVKEKAGKMGRTRDVFISTGLDISLLTSDIPIRYRLVRPQES